MSADADTGNDTEAARPQTETPEDLFSEGEIPGSEPQAPAAGDQALEDLMTTGTDAVVDLDTDTWDATEEWIAGNSELDHEPVAAAAAPAEPLIEVAPPGVVDRVLQVMLGVNLLLLAIMVILPGSSAEPVQPQGPAAPAAPDAEVEKPEPEPFVQPARHIGAIPVDDLWTDSVRAAGEGDYPRAIQLLEHYATTATVTDVERRLVYNQLAFYLTKDGRITEAQDYERKSNQLMARSYLPDDLLASARRAADTGDTAAMRSAYARFLLQQRQIPPSLRRHIAEAYLKLGDSYRVDAERAGTAGSKPAPHDTPPPEARK